MKIFTKYLIASVFILILIIVAYPLLGCCDSCGGCGGCCGGDDDLSEDSSGDGSSPAEYNTNNLGQTTPARTQQNQAPSVCDGQSTNTVQATVSKSSTDSGFSYTYSYTIRACSSAFGFTVTMEGPQRKLLEQGLANQGRETSGSDSFESRNSYTQICINSGDSSIGKYCQPVAG